MALLETLQDNFDDNSIDAGKWNTFTANSGTIVESGGKIICTPANSTVGSDSELNSATNYDLTASYAFVNLKQATSGGGCETNFRLFKDGSNSIYMQKYLDGNLYAVVLQAGIQIYNTSAAYNSTNHAWLKIRESGGTIFFDVSTDGVTWNNFGSHLNPIFAITSLRVDLTTYEDNSDATPGAAWFDNFNLLPSSNIRGFMTTNTGMW